MRDPLTGDLFATLDTAPAGDSQRADRCRHQLLRPLWHQQDAVLVGTSGFSFADWVGPFYPHGYTFRDMLPFYSRQFAAVEINASYYHVPPPRTFEQMAKRTPEGFRFVIKLHQTLTHGRRLDPAVIDLLETGIAVIDEHEKLGGLLAQFPWSFRHTADNRRHLVELARAFADRPVFVEFRHASWSRRSTWQLLRDHGLGYSIVDEPALPGLMPPVVEKTAARAYLRLHGRNARDWWSGSGVKRYDYRYSRAELVEWLPPIRELAGRAEQVFVFFNNCHGGQAPQNAQLLHELLAEVA
jgi:uncharacterized protein YecE (DUF72 family)